MTVASDSKAPAPPGRRRRPPARPPRAGRSPGAPARSRSRRQPGSISPSFERDDDPLTVDGHGCRPSRRCAPCSGRRPPAGEQGRELLGEVGHPADAPPAGVPVGCAAVAERSFAGEATAPFHDDAGCMGLGHDPPKARPRTVKNWAPWSQTAEPSRRVAIRPPSPRPLSSTSSRAAGRDEFSGSRQPGDPGPDDNGIQMWPCDVGQVWSNGACGHPSPATMPPHGRAIARLPPTPTGCLPASPTSSATRRPSDSATTACGRS